MDKKGSKSRYTKEAWERKQLKNRIKELTTSRDAWKAKSIRHHYCPVISQTISVV
jgi:hypothetical protein